MDAVIPTEPAWLKPEVLELANRYWHRMPPWVSRDDLIQDALEIWLTRAVPDEPRAWSKRKLRLGLIDRVRRYTHGEAINSEATMKRGLGWVNTPKGGKWIRLQASRRGQVRRRRVEDAQ